MGLPSKGDKRYRGMLDHHSSAHSNPLSRLLDFEAQEAYHGKIVKRYMSFCALSGGRHDLDQRFASMSLAKPDQGLPASSTAPAILELGRVDEKELAILVGAMRKLREGIVASKRVDDFALQAYLFCIRTSILTGQVESYHPALLHLLRTLHRKRVLSPPHLQEFGGYLILDLACRQRDFAQAYAVRSAYGVRDRRTDAILRALVHDNYHVFWQLKRSVDGYQARIMDRADEGMRILALKCLGRSYFDVYKAYLMRVTDSTWEQLETTSGVGWMLDGDKVVIRRPRTR